MSWILGLLAIAAGAAALVVALPGGERDPAEASGKERVTKLKLKRSPYGKVLFANGYAMYVFTRDGDSGSECKGACAKAWPPLKARGKLKLRKGVKRRLVGTTRRGGGSKQLTYDGQPLYGYVDDPRGKVLCHDVVEFGGTWLAVRKSGDPAP